MFLKWAILLTGAPGYRKMMQHHLSIVPTPSCAMRYVTNLLHLPYDREPKVEKLQKDRKNDVEFYETESRSSVASFRLYELLVVRVLRIVD